MNGRCENDALDAAFDVCDACGGEYCQSCLLFPNGLNKAPFCKACAIGNSGVRNRAKKERIQSRGAAKKRRKELRKQAAEAERNQIVQVEDLPDYVFDAPVEVKESKPKQKRLRRKGKPELPDEEEEQDTTEQPMPDVLEPVAELADQPSTPEPASRRLDEMRTNGDVEAATSDEADVWNFPTDFEAKPDSEPEPAAEVEDTPKSPEWEPLHDPDASNPFDSPSAGRLDEDFVPLERNAFPAPDTNIGPMHEPVERRGQPIDTPKPRHRNVPRIPIDYERTPLQQQSPPAPSASDLTAGPAPLVQPEPEPKKRKKKRSLIPSKAKTPTAVVTPEAVQPRVQDPTTDTDAAGQWIPPNLRGMVSEEQQTELPKRRRKAD